MKEKLVMLLLALVGPASASNPPAQENAEVTLERLLSLLNDANEPNAMDARRVCEIVVQYNGENPTYAVAVIDANAVRTCLTFSVPDVEAMKAGKMDSQAPTGRERLVLMHDDRTTVLDHDHRIRAHYPSLPPATFAAPTRTWVKSFLSAYVGRESILTIRERASAKLYEVAIREMTKIDEALSGVLKLYLDTSSLALVRVGFIGKCKMDRDQDGEVDIVRINLSFVSATTESQPGEEAKPQAAKPNVSEYRQVEVR
jgi:hypothetical protein